MMKKIRIYIIIMMAIPVFTSCEDFLEVKPANEVTLTTYDDVKALMGSYIRSFTTTSNNLSGVPIPYRNHQQHLMFAFYADELDADNFLNNAMARNEKALFKESLNWTNKTFSGTIWSEYFRGIGFLNTIVDELENVNGGTAQQRDIVRYEAKVLRAWYLFKLQQYYSPYKRDDLGIPFNLDSEALDVYEGKRKTQTEVYRTILSELKEALDCPTPPRETYNLFYDKKIINALLAQVYIFKGGSGAGERSDYENAINHAKTAMEGRAIMRLNDYEPFTTFASSIYGVFKDKPQSLLTTITYSSRGMYAGMSNSRRNYQFAREEAYKLYSADDVRRSKFFIEVTVDNLKRQSVSKYEKVTAGGGSTSVLVFNFFSVADLHLIVAEAFARMNDTPNAKKWLEDFQKERVRNYTSFAGNDVLKEILDERRREFFMEYDSRWCDLIRDNKAWTRKSDGADPNVTEYAIKENDFRYCLPIPLLQEMAHNKIEQNPGW